MPDDELNPNPEIEEQDEDDEEQYDLEEMVNIDGMWYPAGELFHLAALAELIEDSETRDTPTPENDFPRDPDIPPDFQNAFNHL